MLYFFIHDKKKFQLDYLSIGKYCALGLLLLLFFPFKKCVLSSYTSYFHDLYLLLVGSRILC